MVNILTNIVAIVLVIAGATQAYLQSINGDFNIWNLLLYVAGAVIAYFTGKPSKKTNQ